MSEDLQLTKIWQDATSGTSHIINAIQARRENPNEDVLKELGNALVLLDKSTSAIQQILASSYYHRRIQSSPKNH